MVVPCLPLPGGYECKHAQGASHTLETVGGLVVGCTSFPYIPILCRLHIRSPLLQDEQITLILFYEALVRELLDLLFIGTFKP